jgi:hypothetical protein
VDEVAKYKACAHIFEALFHVSTKVAMGQSPAGAWAVLSSMEQQSEKTEEWRKEEVKLGVAKLGIAEVGAMGGAQIPSGGYGRGAPAASSSRWGGARPTYPRGRGRGHP